jgi:hypothetical protein
MEPAPARPRHEAIDHDDLLVHEWRVTQLARLGIPWSLAQAVADGLADQTVRRLYVKHAMLISKDGRRSLNAWRPAEGDGFQIPSPDRACTRLEYQDSVRAAPPWSGATDADRHLEPASAGSGRAEFAAVRARIIAAADDARRRIARDLQSRTVTRTCNADWPVSRKASGKRWKTRGRSPAGFIPPSFPNAVSGPR